MLLFLFFSLCWKFFFCVNKSLSRSSKLRKIGFFFFQIHTHSISFVNNLIKMLFTSNRSQLCYSLYILKFGENGNWLWGGIGFFGNFFLSDNLLSCVSIFFPFLFFFLFVFFFSSVRLLSDVVNVQLSTTFNTQFHDVSLRQRHIIRPHCRSESSAIVSAASEHGSRASSLEMKAFPMSAMSCRYVSRLPECEALALAV